MKKILAFLTLASMQAFASDCTINTSTLHTALTEDRDGEFKYEDFYGTEKVERILEHKGYTVLQSFSQKSAYTLQLENYLGQEDTKVLEMMVLDRNSSAFYKNKVEFNINPLGNLFRISRIKWRTNVIRLARSIPACKEGQIK